MAASKNEDERTKDLFEGKDERPLGRGPGEGSGHYLAPPRGGNAPQQSVADASPAPRQRVAKWEELPGRGARLGGRAAATHGAPHP